MQDIISGIIYSFAALFIILDPILSVPIFTTMIKGLASEEIHKQAFIAVAVEERAYVPVSHFQQNDF